MIKKILPLILLLIGAGAGVGAGLFLRPAPVETSSDMAKPMMEEVEEDGAGTFEYVKMNNQFVVPIVKDKKVRSLGNPPAKWLCLKQEFSRPDCRNFERS